MNSRISDENIIAALRNEVAALKLELTMRHRSGQGNLNQKIGRGNSANHRSSNQDYDENGDDDGYDDNSNDDLYQQQQQHQQSLNSRQRGLRNHQNNGRGVRGSGRSSKRRGISPRQQQHNNSFVLSPIDEGFEEISSSPPPPTNMSPRNFMPSNFNHDFHLNNNDNDHYQQDGETLLTTHHQPRPQRIYREERSDSYLGGENLNGSMSNEISPRRGGGIERNHPHLHMKSSPESLTTPALQYQVRFSSCL